MTITTNKTFQQLLHEYNLPDDFSFPLELPGEVKQILDSDIVEASWGMTLAWLHKEENITPGEPDPAVIADDANHFHVDWYIDPQETRPAFMLGVKTIHLLALKFAEAGYSGMRFQYSFQTPEQGKSQAIVQGYHEGDDFYYTSDRLSFYKRGPAEIHLPVEEYDPYEAVLRIDF